MSSSLSAPGLVPGAIAPAPTGARAEHPGSPRKSAPISLPPTPHNGNSYGTDFFSKWIPRLKVLYIRWQPL